MTPSPVPSSVVSELLNEKSLIRENPAAWAELRAISLERDSGIFYGSLLNFARRQEEGGNEALASRVYQAIQDGAGEPGKVPSEVAHCAHSRWQALLGQGGSFGDQCEVSSRHFIGRAPAAFLTMGPALLSFSAARLALWNRLAGGATARVLTGTGAKALASLLAIIGVEGPVLTATQHAFGQSRASWTDDLVSNYRMMFGLRAAGGIGILFSRAMGVTRGLGQSLIQHTSALGGMYLTEGGDLSLAKALENLGYFYWNGAWTQRFLGQPFALRELGLEQSPLRPAASVSAWPRLAHAAGSANELVVVRMNDRGGRLPPPKPPRTPGRGAVPPASPSLPPVTSPSSSNPPSTIPRPGARRNASQLATPRQDASSFLPPAPTVPTAAMSLAQLQPLCAFANNIQAPGHKILALARIALEFSYAGHRAEALEYFGSAATLIDSLPATGPLRGRAFSHLALELAKAGDQKGGEVNFQRSVVELGRQQRVPNRSPADAIEAYGLAFTIAGDLIGAGREDAAKKLLDRVMPTYQRELGSQLSLPIGEEAVMKLAAQGQLEEALILAGRMDGMHCSKTLFRLGRSAARQRRFQEAEAVRYLLKGSKEAGDLDLEIYKALALNGEWDEATQRELSVEDPADRTHMSIWTARLLFQVGDAWHAGAINDAQAAFIREHGGSFPPERRAQFFALLAGNCALWDHAQENYTTVHREHYPRLYDSARGELDPFLGKPRELDEDVTEAVAELVFSMQLAVKNQNLVDEGARIEAWLKLLAPSTRSRVIGKVGVKLVEVGNAMPAFDWLKQFGKELPDYSRYQKEISLRELEMGNPEQAIFLAQHISDLGLRFDAFWEIFTWYRGKPVPELLDSTIPPPARR